jgi:DNA invertase Pin-like site-specific DNA recombinase
MNWLDAMSERDQKNRAISRALLFQQKALPQKPKQEPRKKAHAYLRDRPKPLADQTWRDLLTSGHSARNISTKTGFGLLSVLKKAKDLNLPQPSL